MMFFLAVSSPLGATPASRSFFTEIIASVSDIKFAKGGRYILSRDYMTLKVHTFLNLIGALDDICYLGIWLCVMRLLNPWLCLYMSVMGHQHGLGSSINVPGSRAFKTKGQFPVLF